MLLDFFVPKYQILGLLFRLLKIELLNLILRMQIYKIPTGYWNFLLLVTILCKIYF